MTSPMAEHVTAWSLNRRAMLGGVALLAGALSVRQAGAQPRSLDPVNPDISYGAAGYIWGTDIAAAVADTARMGLQGLEPYRTHIPQYAGDPGPLKAMYDAAGLLMPTCSNGGAGQSTNFIDPAQTDKTIADHVKFAREFLVPFKAPVFKINVGARPAGGPNDDQLKTMARTLDELGRQTAAMGIRLAPHPHIWGPLERGPEVARVMELTDPRYVWLTTDTAHLTLGGMDAVKIIDTYFPRVAEVHLKDCDAKYRGNTQTPTRELHDKASVYKNLGVGGGVDFPAVFKVLRDRRFKGWVVLDLDPPRPGDGTGDIHDNLAANVNYLRNTLGVRLPAPRRA
jgi:inosose dehydratase